MKLVQLGSIVSYAPIAGEIAVKPLVCNSGYIILNGFQKLERSLSLIIVSKLSASS